MAVPSRDQETSSPGHERSDDGRLEPRPVELVKPTKAVVAPAEGSARLRALRSRGHRLVGTWRLDRSEREQVTGLVELWSGSGRPFLLALAIVALDLALDRLPAAAFLGDRAVGDVSQAALAIFGAVLGLLGVATLAAAISLTVVQSAAGRYRRYVVDQLADDAARDAFLVLLFITFTVTILQLSLVAAGVMRPAVGLVFPVLAAIASFALLTQYVRQRIRWLKSSEIVALLAAAVTRKDKILHTSALDMSTGSALSRSHREVARGLLRLLSLCLDGLADGEAATIDDAMAAYREYVHVVMRQARSRIAITSPLAAILVARPPKLPERLITLRDNRLLTAILVDSRGRTGSGLPGREADDAALWFEQIALAAAPTPLLAVLSNGRGRDDEFASEWCERVADWFVTTREDSDLVMGLAVLDMLSSLPGAFVRLTETNPEATSALSLVLPDAVPDAITEVASAVTRTNASSLLALGVQPELRELFLARARTTYEALLPHLTAEAAERQAKLAKSSASRLVKLGWVIKTKPGEE